MKILKAVYAYDWAAIYDDDNLVTENHNISVHDISDLADSSPFMLDVYRVTPKYDNLLSNELGGFPKKFSEIGEENLTKY